MNEIQAYVIALIMCLVGIALIHKYAPYKTNPVHEFLSVAGCVLGVFLFFGSIILTTSIYHGS